MKLRAILFGLVAACSGGGGSSQITGGTLGSTHDTSGLGSHDHTGVPQAVDPDLGFRKQYSNAGGMWLPSQMTLPGHAEVFKKMGVKLDAKTLSDPLAAPLGAIISLGGCTASFVSPDGLLVTNHHCVQSALSVNSTKENDIVAKGFLAKTRADEKSAGPAQRVYVAQAFSDVTKKMRDGLEDIKDPVARKDELEKRSKTLVANCEKDKPGLRCHVSSFFRSGMYVLIENLEIRDVRLVYVPEREIGNYGGEIDNWAWPRHTGDFAFMRAYVGKDGTPAAYAADNVPFRPKHHLKVSTAGLKPNDFVMVTGYPGSTSRTKTAAEVRHYVEWYLPYAIAHYKERYAIAKELADGQSDTAIKAGVAKQFIQNGMENFEGQLKGLTSGDLLQRKNAVDGQVKELVAKPGNEKQKAAIAKMEQIIADEHKTSRVDYDRGTAFRASNLLSTSLSLVRWADERAKKDGDRKPGYQDRDVVNATARQKQFRRQYDRTIDRAFFRLALVRALQLPETDRPWLATLLDTKRKQKIDEALIDKTLEGWYAAQTIEDEDLRVALLTKGTMAQLKASKDPFIKAALRVWPLAKEEEKRDDARGGELVLLTPHYVDAMREVLGGLLAPDANGTLRITYGTVKSFKDSKEVVDRPFTVASEILAKNTGVTPFNMPKGVLEGIKAKAYGPYGDATLGGELPVDFLSDLDITGGNSGSPTLNSKGELVGLAFDGTIAGVASNVVFNGATTRTIHVDARYMLWVMDKVDNADHVLREMGIQPKLDPAPEAGGGGGGAKAKSTR
jgi:hypothetical protein